MLKVDYRKAMVGDITRSVRTQSEALITKIYKNTKNDSVQSPVLVDLKFLSKGIAQECATGLCLKTWLSPECGFELIPRKETRIRAILKDIDEQ